MKRSVYMLPVLLLLFCGVSGGVMYNAGYWDTWADKRPALVEEIRADVNPQVGEEARNLLADCVADRLLDLADQAGCKSPADGPVMPQVVACLKPQHSPEAAQAIMGCILTVQGKLSK